MNRRLRIAIDGPSGSGKSTLGRALAGELELPYVDTGAMYRAVAWAVRRSDVSEPAEITTLVKGLQMELHTDPDDFRVFIDGTDVTGELRSPEISKLAARVAVLEEVRQWMVPRQREVARLGAVLEGRDIGTVVLPDADCKFFVTSDEATRIARRAAQLGLESSGAEVIEDVRERDRIDTTRRHSPLQQAEDAVVVDTSDKSVEESLEEMLTELRKRAS